MAAAKSCLIPADPCMEWAEQDQPHPPAGYHWACGTEQGSAAEGCWARLELPALTLELSEFIICGKGRFEQRTEGLWLLEQ